MGKWVVLRQGFQGGSEGALFGGNKVQACHGIVCEMLRVLDMVAAG